jgi:hypothetical protein
VQWVESWRPIETSMEADALRTELGRELPPAHPLFALPLRAIGRRHDSDDVLFTIEDGSGRVAAVHLTWRAAREVLPWPTTTLYEDLWAWAEAARVANALPGTEASLPQSEG